MTEKLPQNEVKAWHQTWWGIVFLMILALPLVYGAVFIYQVVFLVEQKVTMAQSVLQNRNALSQANIPALAQMPTIETSDDPSLGSDNAVIKIVEFCDFQCPYCRESYDTVRRLADEYPNDLKIIFRDFPNTAIHPEALDAAMAASCAFEQKKFWEYHDLLFDNQDYLSIENMKYLATKLGLNMELFNQCFDSQKYSYEAKNDLQDGIQLGITGTPTFFINGNELKGVLPYANFKEVIDQYLMMTGNRQPALIPDLNSISQ